MTGDLAERQCAPHRHHCGTPGRHPTSAVLGHLTVTRVARGTVVLSSGAICVNGMSRGARTVPMATGLWANGTRQSAR